MRLVLAVLSLAFVAACAAPPKPVEVIELPADPSESEQQTTAPEGGPQTAETLDTTTSEEQAAAEVVPEPSRETALGVTVASLGSPSESGFWMKTPLVTTETRGRVLYPVNGRSVQVTLIPIDGPATAGSRLSLSAFRVIEAPLTGLPQVEVFALAKRG